MNAKIAKIIFTNINFKPSQIPKLRGYFANTFPNEIDLHNHLPGGRFSYSFPKIQYRIIDHHPALIAIDSGCDIIKKIFLFMEKIIIKDRVYKINEKEVSISEEPFGLTDEAINYRFISPWMALNQENFKIYKSLSQENKHHFLLHLLRENLKTLSKGFNYVIPDIEKIKVRGNFISSPVMFKQRKMAAFKGNFSMNFYIPEFLGLGKQSARGFGVIRKK